KKMGLVDPEVINTMVLHPAEGCFVEVKGKVAFDVDRTTLKIPEKEVILPEQELRDAVKKVGLKVVAGTVG
ncbi:OAM dimerization domain-containing protein, partial [Salmonella enterica]|uniref:OAM dimerization domain-containing protein n=1 Tax=Salmonella enterica TaxID=28901 RepID=UPI0032968A7B